MVYPQLNKPENPLHNVTIGNSKFQDDVWDLSPLMTEVKYVPDSVKKIDFTYNHNNEMKDVIKAYTYYLLSQNEPQTVITKIQIYMRIFIRFCQSHSINSFQQINIKVFIDYVKYLKEDRKLAPETGFKYCYAVENLLKVGQIKGWAVPANNIFLNADSAKLWLKQARAEKEERKFSCIPDKILNKILDCAIHKEENIITKAGIIILSQTGLRINEVLGIKKGCISTTSEGYTYMTVRTPKTEDDKTVEHKIFVNQLVVDAVKELEEYTETKRAKSGSTELFLSHIHGKVTIVKPTSWGKRLKKFIERWDIRDDKGNLYKLHSHQFRVNFTNDLIKKRVPLTFIMKHFNHVSIEMTQHYSRLKIDQVASMVKDIVKPDSKIAGLNANTIKRNLSAQFKGKTEIEIQSFVEHLSKNMYINPLPTGICLQDSRRGECDNGDGCIFINCPNYVTTEEYYPIHKRELDLLECEMERYKADGRLREYQRLKAKHVYLKPIVDSLERQINEK